MKLSLESLAVFFVSTAFLQAKALISRDTSDR